MKKTNKTMSRVDYQVSILLAAVILISTFCMAFFYYSVTYKDMIQALNDRVFSLYQCVEKNLDKSSFETINSKDDMNTPNYQSMKSVLENIREATGVMYLYTAKETETGELIYVIDGLSYDEDFRYPGDPIEPEIRQDMQRALSGEVVMPEEIKKTQWGEIFVSYLPIHQNNKIVGVVGIEFKASHQYATYRFLKIITPLFALVMCGIFVSVSITAFRRISNPTFRDMANTDRATKMKNRNAFDVDMHNLTATKNGAGIGIIVADLNGLKRVNDSLGHDAGDRYIKIVAAVMRECVLPNMTLYRVGGDEFVAIMPVADKDILENYIQDVYDSMYKQRYEFGQPQELDIELSVSAGCAVFDPDKDKELYSTYKRADDCMYMKKRQLYEQH